MCVVVVVGGRGGVDVGNFISRFYVSYTNAADIRTHDGREGYVSLSNVLTKRYKEVSLDNTTGCRNPLEGVGYR